eukprot:3581143-Amphidinium_carterae.2
MASAQSGMWMAKLVTGNLSGSESTGSPVHSRWLHVPPSKRGLVGPIGQTYCDGNDYNGNSTKK